jgi:hypothetical protein
MSKQIQSKITEVEPAFRELADSFGEDTKSTTEFFGHIFRFSKQLDKAFEDNLKSDELERKRAEMEERKKSLGEEKKKLRPKGEQSTVSWQYHLIHENCWTVYYCQCHEHRKL